MRWSQTFIPTLREDPAEAEVCREQSRQHPARPRHANLFSRPPTVTSPPPPTPTRNGKECAARSNDRNGSATSASKRPSTVSATPTCASR